MFRSVNAVIGLINYMGVIVVFSIDDLALRVDRSPLTVKRWEKKNLIPAPRRDSRGWRVYSKAEVDYIVNLVLTTKSLSVNK